MYCPACGHANAPGNDTCGNCMLSLAHLNEPALHDRVERSLATEAVAVLNPPEPVTVTGDADLGLAIRQMVERNVGAVLVVDAGGTLAGVLTERDFLRRVAGLSQLPSLRVCDFMTRTPETVTPTDTLAFALGKMDAGGYRHLPVVDGGRPIGMISVRDILRHVSQICQNG